MKAHLEYIINEGFTASDIGAILKVYRDFASGLSHREMDDALLDRALQALKTYYSDYIDWNRKYAAHKKDELNMKVKRDYVRRYNEIASALESFDKQKKLIAIDNGINQLHIDYPVLGHMQFHIYDIEDDDPENATQAQKDFDELFDTLTELLQRQGKTMPEGGYAFEKEPRRVITI
jgi:predicted transcriptional regulator